MLQRLLLLLILVSWPVTPGAEEIAADRPVLEAQVLSFDELVGREFSYDISFLWFDRLAKGRFSLLPGEQPGTYRAVLEARTLGVAAWLTQDRVQSYVALMERQPDGRLRSLRYESRIIRRRDKTLVERSKRFTFDHVRREVRIEKLADGQQVWEEVRPMAAESTPNDILTAFFNFRAGYFGPLEPGRHYLVPTFNRQGAGNIEIDLLSGKERDGLDFFPAGGLVARLKVDPEIFDSEDGGIYVWLDDQLRPARGIVQNVIGLGDVRGSLRP
ncbi:DUF3108 domain-containing protein [Desulfuromonas sp. DDH964]|uniref:DUF3108 domain-containing protein n=1 Tax=Desulfuromonas sp. DDH964 TaxID=1823759 RepID=UPI00082ADE80|nr:DUF3108 domain-containing protein [Desulfuromonas sp. DDH964]